MTNRLGALISCAFILLQPFTAVFADPVSGTDPVAVSPSNNGVPTQAPQVPSLSNTVTPEIASLLAPAANQQQTILDVALTVTNRISLPWLNRISLPYEKLLEVA